MVQVCEVFMTGDIQSGMPWVGANNPIFGDTWVQLQGPDSEKVQFDDLSPSEQVYIIQFLLNPQVPILAPPTSFQMTNDKGNIVGIQAAASLDETQHAIISQLLDKWLISIKENADAAKEKDEKQRIIKHDIQRQIDGLSAVKSSYQNSQEAQDANFAAVSLGIIITGIGITQAMMPNPTTGTISVNPIQDIANTTIQQIAPDLTMVIPVFCMGILYSTAAEVINKPANGEEKKDFAFAKQYAENIRNLVGSASFNNFLMALVTVNVAKGEPVSEERMTQLMSAVKLVLLASSLALVYIAEAGGMTSIEFRAMLNGSVSFPADDVRSKLLGDIKELLKRMDPEEAHDMLAALDRFFDNNQTLDTLSSPSKVFQNLNTFLPRGDLSI